VTAQLGGKPLACNYFSALIRTGQSETVGRKVRNQVLWRIVIWQGMWRERERGHSILHVHTPYCKHGIQKSLQSSPPLTAEIFFPPCHFHDPAHFSRKIPAPFAMAPLTSAPMFFSTCRHENSVTVPFGNVKSVSEMKRQNAGAWHQEEYDLLRQHTFDGQQRR
jgi:hypothetical protein